MTSKKPFGSKNQSEKGQSIVEYAGMIVMSTLLVGGMMSSTKQLMPVIFTALSHNNAAALSDEPPAPASTMRAPAPRSSLAQAHGDSRPTPGRMTLPSSIFAMPSTNESSSFKMALAPQPEISELNSKQTPNHSSVVHSIIASPAAAPTPAPTPNVFPGPAPAPAPAMAPAPKVITGPTLAPVPAPAPTS